MPSVDELLNSSSVNDEEFQRLTKYVLAADYDDEQGPVEVNGRSIGDLSNQISVEGEDNSQYIQFLMPRYYDGIDLTEMLINIHYELSDGQGSNDYPVNAYYSDAHIKFGWIIPQQAVSYSGEVSFCIFAAGTKNYKNYVLKTETKKYTVKSGLDVDGGMIEPDENWYLNFALRYEQETEEMLEEAYRKIDEYAQHSFNIDTELDGSSSHAVANSAVVGGLNAKQNKVTVSNGLLIF